MVEYAQNRADLVRKVNLIEVLMDKACADGRAIEEPPTEWSEERIMAHFGQPNSRQSTEYKDAEPDIFNKWFPGLKLSATACSNARWRVLCFPNAGSAEDMYSSEGTGSRRVASPLLEWCRRSMAECLAVQPPGRNMRMREQPITSCQHMAAALLPVVASRLCNTPYIVVAHSVGTWCAYEFLMLARDAGLPMPKHIFLSAMAAPDIPEDRRPWRRNKDLDEDSFKEECRGWDVNEVVFGPAMWPTYHSLMCADFTLFDEYKFQRAGEAPLDCPITAFYGSRDRRITQGMVEGWQRFTTSSFEVIEIGGHHLWPLDRQAKVSWLEHICQRLYNLETAR